MAAVAVGTFTMPLELYPSEDGSFAQAVFGASASFTRSGNSAVDLPRAASYNDFSKMQHDAQSDSTSNDGTRDSSSSIDEEAKEDASVPSSGTTTPDLEAASLRRVRAETRPELPRLATGDELLKGGAVETESKTAPILIKTPVSAGSDDVPELPAPTNHLLSSRFRRRSWMPTSRSPSPGKRKSKSEGLMADAIGKASSAVRRSSPFRNDAESDDKEESRSRSSSLSRNISNKLVKKRRSVALDDSPKLKPASATRPAHPSHLSKSFSTDRLSLAKSKLTGSAPPLARLSSKEKQRLAAAEALKKRDELWTAFRNLDAEHQKFLTKPTMLKANVVRASLLPFLREYRNHPSTYGLRHEDLERRANILGKWWGSLLELIMQKSNQTVAGGDRPAIFDSILGIMERPEWRLSPSPYAPLKDRKKAPNLSSSEASASSESPDLMIEDSVAHNVRNMFQSNLIEQMGYVVDKMSVRNAPASSISFCGRTCAYAFFFCPGIADVLIRLWNPTMDSLYRVLQECGHKRSVTLSGSSQTFIDYFPAHLATLQFRNITTMYKALRKPAPLPMRTHHLPWSSHLWVSRWCGRDSDLFYVFTKHYHMLVVEFLPPETTRTERLCAPGYIFVHGQILTNMDAAVHRNAQPTPSEPGSTFDDILSDPDSTAPAFPLPPAANASRQMGENRLIILVRDLLSERSTNPDPVRHIFAIAFAELLKATARRTSMYDPNAVYILCDLVEEAFLILVRYEQLNPALGSVIDWPFWIDVWKRILGSHNTTTEIRLYSLLYSLWPAIVVDAERRLQACSSFLLDPEFFTSRFNHWCPMVRAYFMRFLCWRVARHDGEERAGDLQVMERLNDCLQTQYSYYLYEREVANHSPSLLPSTAPCNPAPGRRLLIVRIDALPNANRGAFMSFDGVLQLQNTIKCLPNLQEQPRPVSGSSTDSDQDVEDTTSTKRWGLFRTIIGTSKQETTRASPGNRAKADANRAAHSSVREELPDSEKPQFRPAIFKFSLEWADRLDRRLQTPGAMRIVPPRLPMPAQKFLADSLASNSASVAAPLMPPRTGVSSSSSESLSADAKSTASDSNRSTSSTRAVQPQGEARTQAKYAGRALAEWMLVVAECSAFFERRKSEGVPGDAKVETPALGVENFKRPG